VSVSFVRCRPPRATRVIPAIYPQEQVEKHQRGVQNPTLLGCCKDENNKDSHSFPWRRFSNRGTRPSNPQSTCYNFSFLSFSFLFSFFFSFFFFFNTSTFERCSIMQLSRPDGGFIEPAHELRSISSSSMQRQKRNDACPSPPHFMPRFLHLFSFLNLLIRPLPFIYFP